MDKKILLFAVMLSLVILPASAVMGAIAGPSEGDFKFSRQGGTIQWTVFDRSDVDGVTYTISFAGPAAELATVSGGYKVREEPMFGGEIQRIGKTNRLFEVSIPKGDFKSFFFTIKPPANVEYGKKYPIWLSAEASPPKEGASGGAAINTAIVVSAQLNVIFEDLAGPPTLYQSVDVEATQKNLAERRAKETNWLLVALLIIIVIAILISVYYFYKKKKEEEE